MYWYEMVEPCADRGQDACETPARHQGAWAIKGLSTELELAGIMRGCLGYQTGHALPAGICPMDVNWQKITFFLFWGV